MTMAPGGFYPVSSGTGTTITQTSTGNITLGGTSTTGITVNSPMQTTKKLYVEDIDVGQTLKMLVWFIQAYHPNVLEEFKAIEDIKK